MLYRTMKGSDQKLSILGYGCMRLPLREDGHVSKEQAIADIRYAIDHGVNYIDTAYGYHNGESEVVVGEALKDGYRQKVSVATKLPSFIVNSRKQMDDIFEEQLQRLRTDHIDYYLIHNLSAERWQKMKDLGIKEFMDKRLASGEIKYAGFSFHDHPIAFPGIVDDYDWTFCQIQYNYIDEDCQAGTSGLLYAASKGLGVIVMEPLRGGFLTKPIPAIGKIWEDAEIQRSPAEWGLRWVWNHPELTVVLSGMSTHEQVADNIRYAEKGLPGSLTAEDLSTINKVRDIYMERVKIPCTGCGYCMPCPNGINIPENFSRYNNAFMFDSLEHEEKTFYAFIKSLGMTGSVSDCAECGQCEENARSAYPYPRSSRT